MRTTLVISDPVYERAKRAAREKGVRLSTLITEATEGFLIRMQAGRKAERHPFVRVSSRSMGVPQANIDDREELYRKMEEV